MKLPKCLQVIFLSVIVSACGGNGGGSAPSSYAPSSHSASVASLSKFTGNVNAGDPVPGVAVSVDCNGVKATSGPTDQHGNYIAEINASPPCALEVILPGGNVLKSMATEQGIVNINQITDLGVKLAKSNPSELPTAKNFMLLNFPSWGVELTHDPFTESFKLAGSDPNAPLIQYQSMIDSAPDASNLTGQGSLNEKIFAQCKDKIECMPIEATYNTIDDELVKELAHGILEVIEGDRDLFDSSGLDAAGKIIVRRSLQYSVGLYLKIMSPHIKTGLTAKALGLNKGAIRQLGVDVAYGLMRDANLINALKSLKKDQLKKTGIQLVLGVWFNCLTGKLEKQLMPWVNAGEEFNPIKSLAFGTALYSAKTASLFAISCVSNSTHCRNIVGRTGMLLKAEFEVALEYVIADVWLIKQIFLASNNTEEAAEQLMLLNLAADIERVNGFYSDGLKQWLNTGMNVNDEVYFKAFMPNFKDTITSMIPYEVSAEIANQATAAHLKYYDSMLQSWDDAKIYCRKVGATACLRGLGVLVPIKIIAVEPSPVQAAVGQPLVGKFQVEGSNISSLKIFAGKPGSLQDAYCFIELDVSPGIKSFSYPGNWNGIGSRSCDSLFSAPNLTTTIQFTVQAFDNEASNSAVVEYKTSGLYRTPLTKVMPNKSAQPTLVNKSASNITLKWDAVPLATYYVINRSGEERSTKTLTFDDNFVTANRLYVYSLKACNLAGCSAYSNPLEVTASNDDVITPVPVLNDAFEFIREFPLDDTTYRGATSFTKTWIVKNTGTTTWNGNYCVEPTTGVKLGSKKVCVIGTVRPNAEYSFNVPMIAPASLASAISYRQDWRLKNASGNAFGTNLFARINVSSLVLPVNAKFIDPITAPDIVRESSEAWNFSVNTTSAVHAVRITITDKNAKKIIKNLTKLGARSFSFEHTFTSAGAYNWTMEALNGAGSLLDSRFGSVNVLSQLPIKGDTPSFTFAKLSQAKIADNWKLEVNTTAPASTVRLQIEGQSGFIPFTKVSESKFTFNTVFNEAKNVKFKVIVTFKSSPIQTDNGVVQVLPETKTPQLPGVDTPFTFKINTTNNGMELSPWHASLSTNIDIYEANLIFGSGRRIPLDFAGTMWETRDINSTFSEAGSYPYTLEIRRYIDSPVEIYSGGILVIKPRTTPEIKFAVISSASVGQGMPYNLLVKTEAPVDKVTVDWSEGGGEQGLAPRLDGSYEYGNRLFMNLGTVSFTVRIYKDGYAKPLSELSSQLVVTKPSSSIKLIEVSKNIIVNEKPYFTVETSLAVEKVVVSINGGAGVSLTSTGGSGAVQNFRGQVLAPISGNAVPYTITGFDSDGKTTSIAGILSVAAVGDNLSIANPMPSSVFQNQTISVKFATKGQPNEMWMEFKDSAGGLTKSSLVGFFMDVNFQKFLPGTYTYTLMRRDYLGNVFAIGGASGTLDVKAGGALVKFVKPMINGTLITSGSTYTFKVNELINYVIPTDQVVSGVAVEIPSVPWKKQMNVTQGEKSWSTGMNGLPVGVYAASLYATDKAGIQVSAPDTIDFFIKIIP